MAQSEKVTLIICDGFGLSPEINGNAVANTATPTFDYLLAYYPSMSLLAAGAEVGLDVGEPGNSEVGHLTIGTGQVLPQAFQIINGAIKSEAYKTNSVFLRAMESAKKNNSTLHLVGMISRGGVHGHLDHILALLKLASEKGIQKVTVHAIADGRDSPQRVAAEDGKLLEQALSTFSDGRIASISGRFYAMDRDNHWERTDAAYWTLLGKSKFHATSFAEAVAAGYARGETDENLQPTILVDEVGESIGAMTEGDVVIFTNYRPDRIRQLATRVIMTSLTLTIVTMTDYFLIDDPHSPKANTTVMNAYPLPKPKGTLTDALSRAHKSQLHISESEKYAHMTYFFNGHEEKKKSREEWLLLPSVKVDTFDRAPEMSAAAIASAYLNSRTHPVDFTAINFANADMVGHTGNYEATRAAIAALDTELKKIVDAVESSGEWLILTADHGNSEQMINPISGDIDKEHTTNPVPFLVVHPSLKRDRGMTKQQLALLSQVGMLADVAPTILDIMEVDKPMEMVGTSLLSQIRK